MKSARDARSMFRAADNNTNITYWRLIGDARIYPQLGQPLARMRKSATRLLERMK